MAAVIEAAVIVAAVVGMRRMGEERKERCSKQEGCSLSEKWMTRTKGSKQV